MAILQAFGGREEGQEGQATDGEAISAAKRIELLSGRSSGEGELKQEELLAVAGS